MALPAEKTDAVTHSAHSESSAEHIDHAGAAELAVAMEKGKDVGAGAHCSDADNKRILRKTDLWMLSLLCMVYFLQSADKGIIGLTAVYGLKKDVSMLRCTRQGL